MIAICGAGSVGLVLGARLAAAGHRVLFVTRRREAAAEIESRGVQLDDVVRGQSGVTPAAAVDAAGAAGAKLSAGDVILFCTRGSDLEGAALALAAVASGALAVCLQNDVHHEAVLARHFARVIGGAVRLTCTRRDDRSAVAAGAGRVVLGDHPTGISKETRDLGRALADAGFDVGLSERIGQDKWLKLCVNLMSAPNALVRRSDHTGETFVEVKARLLEEAQRALAAAGIVARSCDGRDRSLEEEIRWQRESLARGQSARPLPVYNQVWTALARGGALEADGYHQRILDLCAAHGLPAPVNRCVLSVLLGAWAEKRGPECAAASELLAVA